MSTGQPFPESLCHACAAPPKYVRTGRSVFIRCPLLPEKYPRQPVRACPLFRAPVLTTERLWLRELTDADEPFVATLTGSLGTYSAAEWIARNRERYARDGFGLWLAIERTSGQPVGAIGLVAQIVDGAVEPEVGYHMHARARGRGLATEAALAVRDWAFARGHDHVVSLIRPDNAASQAVARKLGMSAQRRTHIFGGPHDVWRADRPRR